MEMTYNMFVTCFHEFRIHEIFLAFFIPRQDISIEINSIPKTVYFHKKRHFAAPF